jgi:hypothetical protein
MLKMSVDVGNPSVISKKRNSKDLCTHSGLDIKALSSLLSCVSDYKSLLLFTAIADANISADAKLRQPQQAVFISHMNLTRKQYYSRVNRLRDAGLIQRKGSRFILTSFGKIVHENHKTLGLAIHNHWKLHAIDSLDSSLSAEGMPIEERHKLVIALLGDNDAIKDMLLTGPH